MSTSPSPRSRKLAVTAAALVAATALAGCSEEAQRGFLPESAPGATNHTDTIMSLWNNSWIAALAVGVLVWGLLLWCVVAYRRRKGDNELPVQLRYHVPLELMYTFVPIVMVGVLFAYTSRSMGEILDTSATPDVEIEVVGKRWSWDFNYTSDDVHFSGVQAQLTGVEGVPETLPTLYLPQGELVEISLRTRDVNHAFWVPGFLMKLDMISGRTNTFQIVPEKTGVYEGKCAELCGEYHASMLFNVEVVTPEEYDQQMAALADQGNTGLRGPEYDPQYFTGNNDGEQHQEGSGN
ncbi:aa3-type cytochrome oxidase subunit II [Serinibacter arcticus]|uniref:cytochrome-c oxidase n=1 Tax=Serinibacter arcticus TaxID=1655435 RepID=A0A4Z1E0I7_9MICO|nr:cytochrome c oxidase subunit II [Serinibacter arcticus]TGO04850.1 Cytochrome c oxidase polypeptide II [Serinibacter arcticus]